MIFLAPIIAAISISAPPVLVIMGEDMRVPLVVQVHVPPQAENAKAILEIVAGGVTHKSEWPLWGAEERWLVRWRIKYWAGEGTYEMRATLLKADGTVIGRATIRGEVSR